MIYPEPLFSRGEGGAAQRKMAGLEQREHWRFLPMGTERKARQLKRAGQGARRALGYGSRALSD